MQALNILKNYSSTDLSMVLGVSRQAVEKKAQREKWLKASDKKFIYEKLPDTIKAKIIKKVSDTNENILTASTQVIPDWSYKIGLARFQIVAAWRDYCRKQSLKKIKKGEATAAFLLAYNTGLVATDAFPFIGEISDKTLYRWDKTLRDTGDDLDSICDGRGDWKKSGAKGQGQISIAAQEAFLAAWLTPNRPSVTLAYRSMEAALKRQELEIPSLASVYRFSKRFEAAHNDLVVLKREGEKALADKVLPYNKRNADILEPGDCWFADGHTLNFECLHPETGKPFRPTLLLWYDWKSGMPVGWEIMPTENVISISSSLRNGIVSFGQYPKVVYLDNGRAFKCKYFNETQPDFEILSGLYARLGIATQFAIPYNGRAKIIERFFGTFNEQFARLMPSYTGQNINEKPAWRMRNEKYHKARHEKQDMIPTLREAMKCFAMYVQWFAGQPHPNIPGKTHGEVLAAGFGPGVNDQELDRHFLWTKKITPDRCGFTLAGIRYESDALYGLKMEIALKFTWADLSEIQLYTLDGEKLGVARPQIELHPLARHFGDEHDRAMVANANRRIASLKKGSMQEARSTDKQLAHLPGLKELSYVPKRIEPQPIIINESVPSYDMSEEERQNLLAVYENAVSDLAAAPKFQRPKMFTSEFEKYDWLFINRREGYQPTPEDLEFMLLYEESSEYKKATGGRYEQFKNFDAQAEN